MKQKKNAKMLISNIFFIILCASVLIFLLRAPKETTTPLPHDDIHNRFYAIEDKKEAEKFCLDCHDQGKTAPLSETHPPKYRCLFCHKRL